ncbi:MAG: cyclase family protein [Actinobacteria bacterium]|nr:cyclase family protein [Actinomycetota bacterium]
MPLSGYSATIAEKVSNWGRWGDADERGTLNLIDADAVRRGVEAVRRGVAFSLAMPLDEDGPQPRSSEGRMNPRLEMVSINQSYGGVAFSDDKVTLGLQAATHWDALAHVSYDGLLYNGFPADSVTEAGAAHCGIDKTGPIAGRGVLLDVARAVGVERLAQDHAIGPDDLDAASEFGRVSPSSGDVVLLRTGQMQLFHAGDKQGYWLPNPGPWIEAVEWFHARDLAAVATDTLGFELIPAPDGSFDLPVHGLCLRDMGMLQGQNWDLEELAGDCAEDGVYEFLLEASPEPFTRACGAPVNPIAVK